MFSAISIGGMRIVSHGPVILRNIIRYIRFILYLQVM